MQTQSCHDPHMLLHTNSTTIHKFCYILKTNIWTITDSPIHELYSSYSYSSSCCQYTKMNRLYHILASKWPFAHEKSTKSNNFEWINLKPDLLKRDLDTFFSHKLINLKSWTCISPYFISLNRWSETEIDPIQA